jgi:hypothetical protein
MDAVGIEKISFGIEAFFYDFLAFIDSHVDIYEVITFMQVTLMK